MAKETAEGTTVDPAAPSTNGNGTKSGKGRAIVGYPPLDGTGYIGMARATGLEHALHDAAALSLSKDPNLVTGDERSNFVRRLIADAIGFTGDLSIKATQKAGPAKAAVDTKKVLNDPTSTLEAQIQTVLKLAEQLGKTPEGLAELLLGAPTQR